MNQKIKKDDWIKYSIGPEILPLKHIRNFSKIKYENKTFVLEPVSISTIKNNNNLFYRTYHFVDLFELKKFTDFIDDNKNKIINFFKKIENFKKISQYQIFNKEGKEFINLIELKSISKNTENSYVENILREVKRSSLFMKNRSIDIARFYDSIYTHSIEWTDLDKAISGKMDEYMKNINGKMTSGIPTGPIVSKIFSEIILSQIMLDLSKKIKMRDVHIHRFADDFTIYFNEEKDFNYVSENLSKILNKYKLNINKEKLENNYTFNSSFKQIKISYNEKKIWEIFLDQININIKKNKHNQLKKIILNEVSKINNNKEKSSFYKFILKCFANKHKFILNNIELTELFIHFSIHYISISDNCLNIPFKFLEKFIDELKMKNKEKNYKIDDLWKKLWSLYKKTNSEAKKIFLFDFIFTKNKKEIDNRFIKNKLKEFYNQEKYLHISQLLESNKIEFEDININEEEIKIKYKRVSKEWILFMYSKDDFTSKYRNQEKKSYLLWLKKNINAIKPFNYNKN